MQTRAARRASVWIDRTPSSRRLRGLQVQSTCDERRSLFWVVGFKIIPSGRRAVDTAHCALRA